MSERMELGKNDKIFLASGSPRRSELLKKAGVEFTIHVTDTNEDTAGTPREMVRTLAVRKAQAAAAEIPQGLILAADTLVALEDRALGKPDGEQAAFQMLKSLSGRTHEVFTGVCVMNAQSKKIQVREARTSVTFKPLTDEEIISYIETGEPMDKAGAYAIQGRAKCFVEALEGPLDNVIGLPVDMVLQMLKEMGR